MIRIGIVGCGRILAAHLRGYRLLRQAGIDTFRITALCSRQADDARMYLRRGGEPRQRPAVSTIPGDPLNIGDEYLSDFQPETPVEVYSDYRRMVAEAPIDAVNDFSTHALHHQVAEVALAAGKHLLSQKPLAVSLAAARRMCQTAEQHQRVFAVFENFRFAPSTRQLRWLFQSGLGGQLQMILLNYVGVWWAPDLVVAQTPWRHRRDEAGGISLDLGVHFFDQIRHVAGEIRSVCGQTAVLERQRYIKSPQGQITQQMACDADDTCLASFDTSQGVVGNLVASWAGHGGPLCLEQGSVYLGTKARVSGDEVRLDNGPPQSLDALYHQQAPLEEQRKLFPLGLTDSFALSQLDWLESIRLRRPPETSGLEGLRDLAAAMAILESCHAGRRVNVDEVASGQLREFQRPIDARYGLSG